MTPEALFSSSNGALVPKGSVRPALRSKVETVYVPDELIGITTSVILRCAFSQIALDKSVTYFTNVAGRPIVIVCLGLIFTIGQSVWLFRLRKRQVKTFSLL